MRYLKKYTVDARRIKNPETMVAKTLLFCSEKLLILFGEVSSPLMLALYPASSTAAMIAALLVLVPSWATTIDDRVKFTCVSCTPSSWEIIFCSFEAQSGQSSPARSNEDCVNVLAIEDISDSRQL